MFKLHCDRCGAFIKEVGGPEAKTISLGGPVKCKDCISFAEKMDKSVAKLRKSWEGQINRLVAEAQKDLETLG